MSLNVSVATLPKVPGARLWLNVDQDIRFGGGFGGGSYQYTLRSDSVPSCGVWAQRVREALKPLPELTGIEDELVSSQQISLEVDREAARRLGIEMATVTQALNNAFGQRQVSTIYNAMNQYRVVMEVAPQFAQGPESLDQVYVVDRDRQPSAAVRIQPLHTDICQRPHQPQRPVRLRERRPSSSRQASA